MIPHDQHSSTINLGDPKWGIVGPGIRAGIDDRTEALKEAIYYAETNPTGYKGNGLGAEGTLARGKEIILPNDLVGVTSQIGTDHCVIRSGRMRGGTILALPGYEGEDEEGICAIGHRDKGSHVVSGARFENMNVDAGGHDGLFAFQTTKANEQAGLHNVQVFRAHGGALRSDWVHASSPGHVKGAVNNWVIDGLIDIVTVMAPDRPSIQIIGPPEHRVHIAHHTVYGGAMERRQEAVGVRVYGGSVAMHGGHYEACAQAIYAENSRSITSSGLLTGHDQHEYRTDTMILCGPNVESVTAQHIVNEQGAGVEVWHGGERYATGPITMQYSHDTNSSPQWR